MPTNEVIQNPCNNIENSSPKNSTIARECNNNRKFSIIEFEGDLYQSYKKIFIYNKTSFVDAVDQKSFSDSLIYYGEFFLQTSQDSSRLQ